MEEKMSDIKEQDIQEKAYQLWEQAGRPDGGAEDFWHQARDALTRGETAATQPDAKIDNASEESFPASDPINHM
jgi:hypothetical protein